MKSQISTIPTLKGVSSCIVAADAAWLESDGTMRPDVGWQRWSYALLKCLAMTVSALAMDGWCAPYGAESWE